MKLFDIFKSKEEKELLKIEEENKKKEQIYLDSLPKCDVCQNPIDELNGDKRRNFGGKKMHLECFRDMRKELKKKLWGGEL